MEELHRTLQRCVEGSTAAPYSELRAPVQRTNTGRAGTAASFFALPLDYTPTTPHDPMLQCVDPTSKETKIRESFSMDFLLLGAKKDSPGTVAAPFEYQKSAKIKDPKKLQEFNMRGRFVVDSNPGEEGMVFHAFDKSGQMNRGAIVPGKSFRLGDTMPVVRFWMDTKNLAERPKLDSSGQVEGPKFFGSKMGADLDDLCKWPLDLRIITIQQKNVDSFKNQAVLKIVTLEMTSNETLQFLPAMRAKLPKSKAEALQSARDLLQSADIPYAKQVPHRAKDAQGNVLEEPEITKAVYLHENVPGSVCFR